MISVALCCVSAVLVCGAVLILHAARSLREEAAPTPHRNRVPVFFMAGATQFPPMYWQ